jgi:hypothetical protein
MAPSITNHVIIAKLLWKQSSLCSVVDASGTFVTWHQMGHKGGIPGSIRFESLSGPLSMILRLHSINGLYYCPLDVLAVDPNPVRQRDISVSWVVLNVPISHLQAPLKYKPVSKDHQLESKVWSLCLGCPGKHQLDVLSGNVSSIPSVLEYHPFRFIDFCAQARVLQQAAQRLAVRIEHCCKKFHVDFGFMHSSSQDYSQPSKTTDCVVQSYDGYSSYLILWIQPLASFGYS